MAIGTLKMKEGMHNTIQERKQCVSQDPCHSCLHLKFWEVHMYCPVISQTTCDVEKQEARKQHQLEHRSTLLWQMSKFLGLCIFDCIVLSGCHIYSNWVLQMNNKTQCNKYCRRDRVTIISLKIVYQTRICTSILLKPTSVALSRKINNKFPSSTNPSNTKSFD